MPTSEVGGGRRWPGLGADSGRPGKGGERARALRGHQGIAIIGAMAVLLEDATGRRITLGVRSLVGRAPRCTVRLDQPWVSAEHASIYWREQGWEIRDLGSRNGTYVDGNRLPTGGRAHLARGMKLGFGAGQTVWHFLEDGPPVLTVRNLDTGAIRQAEGGLLVLPDESSPAVTFYQRDMDWRIEGERGDRALIDQEILELNGARWMIEMPHGGLLLDDTTGSASGRWTKLSNIGLRFEVSLDQEHVSVLLIAGRVERQIPVRAYHDLLLQLARARLGDRASGLPEPECGWLYGDELAQMLKQEPTKINVDVYRARRQLAEEGIADAASLVERRSTTHQLRIGVERLEVRP